MKEAILVTGASGLVGSWLVNRLLECHPDAEIFLLLRATSRREASNRVSVLHRQRKQVTEVSGDVCLPKLGLGSAYEPLAGRVTEIFHAAAHTKFPARQEEVEAVNVRGTENVVSFAIACRSLSRLHHVSTAFVSGTRSGTILETAMNEGQDFSNTYERSKLRAETIVQRCGESLPVTIYRPSIVVGDSVSGATLHFRGIYQIMKASYAGLLEFIPGHRSFLVDVVPVDFVANAIVQIGASPESAGKTFHLTTGPERRMNTGTMVDLWIDRAAHHGIEIRQPVFGMPEDIAEAGMAGRRSLRLLEHLAPYLNVAVAFDRRQTEAFLAEASIECPPLRDYYFGLIDFAIGRRFGLSRESSARTSAPAATGSD
jgi:thioester reductase-like protein